MPTQQAVAETANLSSLDDHTLLKQIARGDRRAFEQFYDRYAGQVYGLALRMVRDRAVSDDVLQEAFWRVWTRAGQFDVTQRSGNVRAWLLTIVHHLAIDAQRRQRREPLLESEDNEDSNIDSMAQRLDALVDEDTDVFEHVFANISSERVRSAINTLEERHRNVIEMSFFHGLTHRQIAEQLGEPLGTIHSRALQGMAALRALLWQQLR